MGFNFCWLTGTDIEMLYCTVQYSTVHNCSDRRNIRKQLNDYEGRNEALKKMIIQFPLEFSLGLTLNLEYHSFLLNSNVDQIRKICRHHHVSSLTHFLQQKEGIYKLAPSDLKHSNSEAFRVFFSNFWLYWKFQFKS